MYTVYRTRSQKQEGNDREKSVSAIVNVVCDKITFKRTWSLSNAVCFKYVKYLTTNTAKVSHVTPSRPPLT